MEADTKTGHDAQPENALLSVRETAELLKASSRTVYRLSDRGLMPAPLKLGSLTRWRAGDIDRWIQDGCPRCRNVRGAKK